MTDARFPIMASSLLTSVPWEFIEPHAAQAMANHDQTLNRLAQRGGLSACEALCAVTGRGFRELLSFSSPTRHGETRPPKPFSERCSCRAELARLVEEWRIAREEHLRSQGFDDVSDEQRRANLAGNVVPIQERKR